jgi:hypothetical protein
MTVKRRIDSLGRALLPKQDTHITVFFTRSDGSHGDSPIVGGPGRVYSQAQVDAWRSEGILIEVRPPEDVIKCHD